MHDRMRATCSEIREGSFIKWSRLQSVCVCLHCGSCDRRWKWVGKLKGLKLLKRELSRDLSSEKDDCCRNGCRKTAGAAAAAGAASGWIYWIIVARLFFFFLKGMLQTGGQTSSQALNSKVADWCHHRSRNPRKWGLSCLRQGGWGRKKKKKVDSWRACRIVVDRVHDLTHETATMFSFWYTNWEVGNNWQAVCLHTRVIFSSVNETNNTVREERSSKQLYFILFMELLACKLLSLSLPMLCAYEKKKKKKIRPWARKKRIWLNNK